MVDKQTYVLYNIKWRGFRKNQSREGVVCLELNGFNQFFDVIEKLGFLDNLAVNVWFLVDKIRNQ